MDKLKYWLDVNSYIKQALVFAGLALAIVGTVRNTGSSLVINLGVCVIFLLILMMVFQLILGIREVSIDYKKYHKKNKKH